MLKKRICIGYFIGLGDLICALPSIDSISRKKYDVTIVVHPKLREILGFFKLKSLKVIFLEKKINKSFVNALNQINNSFSQIIISPHAQYQNSSFLVPILFRILKNRDALLCGSKFQRLSFLFDQKISIQMFQPAWSREYELYYRLDLLPSKLDLPKLKIKDKVNLNKNIHQIFFHVGASKKNKTFTIKYIKDFVNYFLLMTNSSYKILISGHDGKLMKYLLDSITDNQKQRVKFIQGNLKKIIKQIRASNITLTMDSGISHLASLYSDNHILICGPTDPILVRPSNPNTKIIFNKSIDCQPCNKKRCSYSVNNCLNNIKYSHILNIIHSYNEKKI